eukprot:5197759-Prorocentrum_lima.AAC.1
MRIRCQPYDAAAPTISATETAKPGKDGMRWTGAGGPQRGSTTCMRCSTPMLPQGCMNWRP